MSKFRVTGAVAVQDAYKGVGRRVAFPECIRLWRLHFPEALARVGNASGDVEIWKASIIAEVIDLLKIEAPDVARASRR